MKIPCMTKELATRLDEAADHVRSCGRCRGSGSDAPMCIIATDHSRRIAEYWGRRRGVAE